MYKRILMATDGSEAATRALDEALALTKEQGAALRIIHVILDQRYYGGDVGFVDWDRFLKGMRQEGEKLVKAAAERAHEAGVTAETEVRVELDGRIARLVLDAARDWKADLIVIGTHGRHGLGHLFLGSVAEEVIRASSVPVLAVRHA